MSIKIINETTLNACCLAEANAIREKTGDSNTITYDWANQKGFADAIAAISTQADNNPIAFKNDVIFIDYDGTIRYSYSKQEFNNLQELPPNPTHEGLTAQGWNWTLSDAQTYMTSNNHLTIGQNYITEDEKTRLYVNVDKDFLTIPLHLYIKRNGSVDWGDNSLPETLTGGTGNQNILINLSHTYSEPGEYIITIDIDSNGAIWIQGSTSRTLLFTNNTEDPNYDTVLKHIRCGKNFTFSTIASSICLETITIPTSMAFNNYSLSDNIFYGCNNLKSLTIPAQNNVYISAGLCRNNFTLKNISIPYNCIRINSGSFYGCSGLEQINIPNSINTIQGYAFQGCSALKEIKFPNTISTIYSYTLQGCTRLKQLIIPNNISTIENYACAMLYGLQELYFYPTTPPSILGSYAFMALNSTCTIYIPYSNLSAYINGTNYPSKTAYTYIGFATYANEDSLPTLDTTEAYNVIWYPTKEDAIAQTNAITIGNGDEIYCRYSSIT